jgi:hypothetical protein
MPMSPVKVNVTFQRPDASPVQRVEITMRRGESPRVFDATSKEELTANVHEIAIAPLGQVSMVQLALFRRDEKGQIVILDGEPAFDYVRAQLVYLRGDWEAR